MLGFECAATITVVARHFHEESTVSLRIAKADSSQKAVRNDSLRFCGYGQNTARLPLKHRIRTML